jgi:hypothetical protein
MVREALGLEDWNRGPWKITEEGEQGQAVPFVLTMGEDEREVIVVPCGHFVDRPKPILMADQIVECKACETEWVLQWDGTGTWTATRK